MDFDIAIKTFDTALSILFKSARFWLPLVLGILGWRLWVSYVQEEWMGNMKWVLLEIRVPKEVFKSPAAMELALSNALSQGDTNQELSEMLLKKFWLGMVQ